jgi:hypothetical protein
LDEPFTGPKVRPPQAIDGDVEIGEAVLGGVGQHP